MVTQSQDGRGFLWNVYETSRKKNDEWSEEKQRKREAYKKFRSHSTRDGETQMEVLEVENSSLYSHRCSLHYAMNVEYIILKLKNNCTKQPVKLEGQDEA